MLHRFAAVALVSFVLLASPCSAHGSRGFSQTYFFGHSNMTEDFSNGPAFSARLADELGGISVPGVTNFAFGGNTTFDLPRQLDEYLAIQGSGDPKALYAIWMGGNDITNVGDNPPQDFVPETVGRIVEFVNALIDNGARNFVVINTTQAFGSEVATDFNWALADAMEALSRGRIRVILLDLIRVVGEMFENQDLFGVQFQRGVCLLDSECAADPMGPIADTFYLYDAAHYTTRTHEIFVDFAVQQLFSVGGLALATVRKVDCQIGNSKRPRGSYYPDASTWNCLAAGMKYKPHVPYRVTLRAVVQDRDDPVLGWTRGGNVKSVLCRNLETRQRVWAKLETQTLPVPAPPGGNGGWNCTEHFATTPGDRLVIEIRGRSE